MLSAPQCLPLHGPAFLTPGFGPFQFVSPRRSCRVSDGNNVKLTIAQLSASVPGGGARRITPCQLTLCLRESSPRSSVTLHLFFRDSGFRLPSLFRMGAGPSRQLLPLR